MKESSGHIAELLRRLWNAHLGNFIFGVSLLALMSITVSSTVEDIISEPLEFCLGAHRKIELIRG